MNVKELTDVLHLKLVFMNVLVLQSFLTVPFQVLQVVQVFQVLAPCVVESFQVFGLYFFQALSV